MPINVRGGFPGTAPASQQIEGQQAFLILAALVVIYIVLGILYESLIHPVTVLSDLALGRRRRRDRAAAVSDGVLDHGADRACSS